MVEKTLQTKEQKDEIKYFVRIANTDIDGNKQVAHGLTKIKGVGFMFSNMVCNIANIDKKTKIGYLKDEDIKKLDGIIKNPTRHNAPVWMLNRRKNIEDCTNNHLVTSDLAFSVENDIKMMKKIRSYKGIRHGMGLPVRGQRTKSNFRKNKGKVLGVKIREGAKGGKV